MSAFSPRRPHLLGQGPRHTAGALSLSVALKGERQGPFAVLELKDTDRGEVTVEGGREGHDRRTMWRCRVSGRRRVLRRPANSHQPPEAPCPEALPSRTALLVHSSLQAASGQNPPSALVSWRPRLQVKRTHSRELPVTRSAGSLPPRLPASPSSDSSPFLLGPRLDGPRSWPSSGVRGAVTRRRSSGSGLQGAPHSDCRRLRGLLLEKSQRMGESLGLAAAPQRPWLDGRL